MHPEDLGLGKLFEMIRDGVIVADAKTQRIVLWNSAATSIFGYPPSEALGGMLVEDLVPERFKDQHRVGIARYLETGRGRYLDANRLLDLPALAKTGEEIRVEFSLSPITLREVNGGAYVLAIVRDVTMRNRAEEYAARLLRHLSGEPESEPDTLLGVSSERRVPLQEAQEAKLTDRELQALRLLALGKTNRQIAQEMLVSVSTAKVHVGHIIEKLGSRTARRRRCARWNWGCFRKAAARRECRTVDREGPHGQSADSSSNYRPGVSLGARQVVCRGAGVTRPNPS